MKKFILAALVVLSSVYASEAKYGDSFIQNGFKVKFLFCDQRLKCHASTKTGSLNKECHELGLQSAFISENPEICPDQNLGTVCGCVEEYVGE